MTGAQNPYTYEYAQSLCSAVISDDETGRITTAYTKIGGTPKLYMSCGISPILCS
jgi:hypothetical protein